MKSRPAPISTASTRKIAPATPSNITTANAIANERLVWSLGNDASVDDDQGCGSDGCASYGRGRSYRWWMTKAATYAIAADRYALPHASFHLRLPPWAAAGGPVSSPGDVGSADGASSAGRARNQSTAVITTMTGIDACSTPWNN